MKRSYGQLRIIGGQWRSRKLPVLDNDGLRPTTDRVRETLFNWIQFDIADAYVLDLFCGSGGLAFEAASRGAKEVLMIDNDSRTIEQLEDNIKTLAADNMRAVKADALSLLASPSELPTQWDIIFVDPPFTQGLANKTLDLLAQSAQVTADTLIYLETESEVEIDDLSPWKIIKDKRHGAVKFALLQRK